MMKIVRTALIGLMFVFGGQAHALLINPGDASTTEASWSSFGNPSAADLFTITGDADLVLLYKDNAEGAEEGPFQDSYDTTYDYEPEAENAYVTYTGGDSISSDPLWLLVKDGNNDPIWYLFNISGWDGIETISIEGFWPNQGAISHVSIFGRVPEPASLLLLGLALIGLGLVRRRKGR